MKWRYSLLAFLLTCAYARHTLAATLPSSCGDAKVDYEVSLEKPANALPTPPVGKAQIVFIERENAMVVPFHYATVRIGMDGTWMGANYNNSYLTFAVDPGEHHLCANWETHLQKAQKSTDVASFTAEAGKTYYFVAQLMVTGGDGDVQIAFSFSSVDEDEGKWRFKGSKLSVATAK